MAAVCGQMYLLHERVPIESRSIGTTTGTGARKEEGGKALENMTPVVDLLVAFHLPVFPGETLSLIRAQIAVIN